MLGWEARAHQPNLSSTILIEQSKNNWILQVRAALTAFEYEINRAHGDSAYSSPKEFQQLLIDLLKKNISIQVNSSQKLNLNNAMVNLGHETTVTFQLDSLINKLSTLQISNTSFANIPRNKSSLFLLKEGFDKNQFSLNDANQNSLNLKLTKTKFEIIEPSKLKLYDFKIEALVIVLILLILLLFSINSSKNAN